jgi:hypothetical protein
MMLSLFRRAPSEYNLTGTISDWAVGSSNACNDGVLHVALLELVTEAGTVVGPKLHLRRDALGFSVASDSSRVTMVKPPTGPCVGEILLTLRSRYSKRSPLVDQSAML